VQRDQSLTFWTHLLAVTFLTTGQVLRADDKPADTTDSRIVPIKSGGSTLNVQVKEPANPYRNVASSGTPDKYQPDHFSFNTTSPLAHKQFVTSDASISQSDSFLKNNGQSTFITKSYFTGATPQADHAAPNIDTQVSLPTSYAYSDTAPGFNKGFATSSFDPGQNRTTAFSSKTSTDQNRTALLGKQAINTFNSPLANKTFEGPDADAVRHDVTRMNEGLLGMKDLPNRPLTIDEVRALINHGVKPDTSKPPEEPPTKPLNDPDYKPEVSPDPPTARATEDDKDEAVPSPGTMAAPPPENSDPLPNH